jgi:hypothetical protein
VISSVAEGDEQRTANVRRHRLGLLGRAERVLTTPDHAPYVLLVGLFVLDPCSGGGDLTPKRKKGEHRRALSLLGCALSLLEPGARSLEPRLTS